MTKSAGYTTSELRKGIATGYIIPQVLHTTEEVRRLLGNMMLGRPRDAAPPGRSGRKPARDRSVPGSRNLDTAGNAPPEEISTEAVVPIKTEEMRPDSVRVGATGTADVVMDA
jgi:hypothetical protein